jgi:hypothetical protein
MLFSACATAGLKTGLRAADHVILRRVYGQDRVAREHLTIVNLKPEPVVSNGDHLPAWGFRHFLISGALFMIVGAGGTVASMFLLPRDMRRSLEHSKKGNNDIGCLPILVFFPLAISLALYKPLWPNALVLALTLAIARLPVPSKSQ